MRFVGAHSQMLVMGLACACFLISNRPAQSSQPKNVRVGVAEVDITPETPVRMYGYASRKTESEGIAGPLRAKALVIGSDAGEGPAVLLAVDCGAVPTKLRQEVFQRVQAKVPLRPERFMLCNSHNHSGPNLKGMASMSGDELEHLNSYASQLTDRLEQVVLQALESRSPARLDWTSGSVDIAANRRVLTDGKWSGFGAVEDGAVDHSLPLMRVTGKEGKLVAVLVNYACHCTTLRGNYMEIHGDWAACAQKYIEEEFPGALALITIGCGADSDPRPHGTVDLCERHGRAMADEVKRLLDGEFRSVEPKITARAATLEVPYLQMPPLETLKQHADESWAVQAMVERLERGEKPPQSEEFSMAVWAFGDDLAMVFFSNEVVVDYALRLKREFAGSRLWINAYTNTIDRYIVSERLLDEGGYEVRNSLSTLISFGKPRDVQPSVEQRIVEQVRQLLPESFKP